MHFYSGKTHSGAFVASQAYVIPWVDARVNGVPADSNCATLTWPGHPNPHSTEPS